MLKINRRQCLISILGSALALGSCIQTAGMLLAGVPMTSEYLVVDGVSRDGAGPLARFTKINDLALDEAGNVYVADLGKNTGGNTLNGGLVRRIHPNGHVETILGDEANRRQNQVHPSPLIGLVEMRLLGDNLYFTSAGCVLRLNISSSASSRQAELVYGRCLSFEESKEIDRNPRKNGSFYSYYISLVNDLAHKQLYVIGGSEQGKPSVHVISLNGIVRESDKYEKVGVPFRVIDSHSNVYFANLGLPGPGTPGSNSLRKKDFQGNDLNIPGGERLDGIGAFTIDQMDNLYLMDGVALKRLSPQGQLDILFNPRGPKYVVDFIALNSQSTAVYLADWTAVYKILIMES